MATTIKIKNINEGYQSIITNGKHSIIGDEPIKSKGTDLGMAPNEMMLSGLAMCKVATMRYIARNNGWELGDVQATLEQEVRNENGLKTVIDVSIKINGDLSPEQKQELIKQANACYIHRQIMGEWQINEIKEIN